MLRKQNLTKGPNESLSLNETDGRKMDYHVMPEQGDLILVFYMQSTFTLHAYYD